MAADTIDVLDESLWQRNPHDVWTWMRNNEPVYHDAANRLWAITRHADVIAVERNANVFPSDHSYRAIPSFDESNMIAQDDPGHKEQRMLVQRFFAPGVVAKRADDVRQTVRALLRAASGDAPSGTRVSFDVIDALAGRLPAVMTAHLMGFEASDWPMLKMWSEQLMRTDSRERIPGVMGEFIGANMSLLAAVEERIAAKREAPGDDLFTVWANADVGGEPMSTRMIMHEAGLFVSGGAETTRTTIAHGLRAFVDHRNQWEMLATDPKLVSSAVEEVLRWVTPLNNFFRVSRGDNQVGDVVIPDGDRAMLVYPSANRDSQAFHDPFAFDITRTPNHHISFGNGPHTCIGAPLARLSLRIVFEEFSRMFTLLSVVSEPDVEANLFARAVKRFELSAVVR
jgi:cholest-4-en-3-one 26-monooxygenase